MLNTNMPLNIYRQGRIQGGGGAMGAIAPPLDRFFFYFLNKNIINMKRGLLKTKWAKSEEF